MKTLRPIQVQKAQESFIILDSKGVVYLAGEVRSGKTATSLEVGRIGGFKNVVFLTKKKAISSIEEDYIDFGFDQHFKITVTNDESMHKLDNPNSFDLVIHDESHRFGGFPKPGKACKLFRQYFHNKPLIMLSGTTSPESFSQFFHQFWVSDKSPWVRYGSFYKWGKDYIDIRPKRIGTHVVNDYTRGDEEKIMRDVKPYLVTMTQAESGFETKVEEEILYVEMASITYKLCKQLLSDLVIEGKEELILADTPAKLQQKLHQLYSGTIKFESGNRKVLDYSKVDFIIDRFKDNKIAIFYKFIAEYQAIKDRLGDKLTQDISEFNSDSEKWIALQIVSGREGTNLSAADYLVMYNIDFSATSYFQARDRMTIKDRKENKVYWIFAKGGIEDKVMKAVSSKKKYTSRIFKKDYKIK
jgi:hypothetical protein